MTELADAPDASVVRDDVREVADRLESAHPGLEVTETETEQIFALGHSGQVDIAVIFESLRIFYGSDDSPSDLTAVLDDYAMVNHYVTETPLIEAFLDEVASSRGGR